MLFKYYTCKYTVRFQSCHPDRSEAEWRDLGV